MEKRTTEDSSLSSESKTCMKKLEIFKKKIKFTTDELEKFRIDDTRNPRTGRRISVKGSIYKQLKQQLEQKDQDNITENIPPKLIVKKIKPKPLNSL
jgi:hypothetical protein